MGTYYDKYCTGYKILHVQDIDKGEKRPHRRKIHCRKKYHCKRYKKGKLFTVKPEDVIPFCFFFLEKDKYEMREIKLKKLTKKIK